MSWLPRRSTVDCLTCQMTIVSRLPITDILHHYVCLACHSVRVGELGAETGPES
jgi:hypothetical protein